MKYAITLTTYAKDKTAEKVISESLGFKQELSNGTIVDIFAKNARHKNGVFTSKKVAQIVANRINDRGSFGGFSILTTANVVAA